LISNENPDHILALSFWKTREDAEKYNREQFTNVTDLIRNLSEGKPKVQTFEVESSTIQKIAADKAA